MSESQGKLRVFISWSLPLSHKVALILQDWLQRLIQSVDPWVSSEDIEKGTWWSRAIVEALDTSTVGIVVITPENLDRTWINFEAGALARAIGPAGGVVAPLLVNVPGSSIEGPMGGLQVTRLEKDDVYKLMQAVNARTGSPLSEEILRDEFDLKWPILKEGVDAAISEETAKRADQETDTVERPEREILEDLVAAVRGLRAQVELTNRGAALPDGSYTVHSDVEIRQQAISKVRLNEVANICRNFGIKVSDVKFLGSTLAGAALIGVDFIGPHDEAAFASAARAASEKSYELAFLDVNSKMRK